MKMMNIILSSVVLLGSSVSFAAPSKAETYAGFCGSLEAVEKVAGEKLSDQELQELTEQRTPILDVLRNGQEAVDALANQENGPIVVLLVCGVLDEISAQVAEKGCTDLNSGDVVHDNGGLAACQQVMTAIKNRP